MVSIISAVLFGFLGMIWTSKNWFNTSIKMLLVFMCLWNLAASWGLIVNVASSLN